MSNRRHLRAPSGSRYAKHVDRLNPSSVEWSEAVEEWRRSRQLADEAYANELMMMAVEDDEPIEINRKIDTPGPEVRHPWWWIFVVGAALGFAALVLCGIVAWIVEALT